ncbi:hypothetical protein ACLB2K_071759 [Fragaria x ananassa]
MLVVEALALRDSLVRGKEKDFTIVEMEGYSRLVIEAVNCRIESPWILIKLIQDNRVLVTSFDSISFKHVFHEANFVAYAIANLGVSSTSPLYWNDRIPSEPVRASEVSRALLFDIVNSGCPIGFSF